MPAVTTPPDWPGAATLRLPKSAKTNVNQSQNKAKNIGKDKPKQGISFSTTDPKIQAAGDFRNSNRWDTAPLLSKLRIARIEV